MDPGIKMIFFPLRVSQSWLWQNRYVHFEHKKNAVMERCKKDVEGRA